jgi:diphosphomevalonate decarboxylase
MPTAQATARAHPNIALIKYWGDRDSRLRLPANSSISMNLAGLETLTTVRFEPGLARDQLTLNGERQTEAQSTRVGQHLDHVRQIAHTDLRAQVVSKNNFPMGTGIASSASAFAALTVAACTALDLELDEPHLSALARLGSGSACRSIPGGFVEWYSGEDHESSYAASIAAADHWEIVDLIAVVSQEHKSVGSTGGHRLADTSPLQTARISDAPRRLDWCREAVLGRNFDALADVIEQDALMMHAVMLTSQPALIYWLPATLSIMQAVQAWRARGIPVAFTIDAGPNVHLITPSAHQHEVLKLISQLEEVQTVLQAGVGGPAQVVADHLIPQQLSRPGELC